MTLHRRGRRALVQLTAALTAALAAVAVHGEDATQVVHLGNLKFAHYGAVSYMKESCAADGVRIEERFFPKGPDILPAVVSGDIDLAALASDGAISGRANGVPIVAVAGFARGGARLVAGVDAGIHSLADLRGKRVGVTRGGAQELLLYAELEKAGLSWSDHPGKDVQIVFLAFADLNQALAAHQIDAMCQSEPQSSQAINRHLGVELLKPYDTPMGEPVRVLVMSEKLYSNRVLAGKVMHCFVKATMQFRADPQLAERYVTGQMFKGQLSAGDYQDALSNASFTYDLSEENMDITTLAMQKYGVGRMSSPPRAADWVRLDLLREAKADLKVK
jgi:NitT/TauT family transport system substrate-binding protein